MAAAALIALSGCRRDEPVDSILGLTTTGQRLDGSNAAAPGPRYEPRSGTTAEHDPPAEQTLDVAAVDVDVEVDADIDPGAAALVAQIVSAIGSDLRGQDRVEIALRGLRNQSRAGAEEVEAVRSRILTLLEPAGGQTVIRFTEGESPRTRYTLGGTVYLIQRDGVEHWEIFFALRPAGANWRIWKNAEPVRLERIRATAGADRISFEDR